MAKVADKEKELQRGEALAVARVLMLPDFLLNVTYCYFNVN